MTERTIKHELYKHGSYLHSLKEAGCAYINIDEEIDKLEELFQLASKKEQPPQFQVGEYYKSEDGNDAIFKVTGYPNSLTLGYLDALRDIEELFYWQPTKLINNQEAVLGWLKDNYEDSGNVFETIYDLYVEVAPGDFKTCLMDAYEKLNKRQLAEVVQDFGEWILKEAE